MASLPLRSAPTTAPASLITSTRPGGGSASAPAGSAAAAAAVRTRSGRSLTAAILALAGPRMAGHNNSVTKFVANVT